MFKSRTRSQVVLLFVLTVVSGCSTFSRQTKAPYASLAWYAEQAEAKDKTTLSLHTTAAGLGSAEDAFDYYTIIEAVQISSVTESDTYSITTWHKFRVVSVLSKATKCAAGCPAAPDVPQALLPLKRNEIAIPVAGGTAMVDGVSVTETANLPKFLPGQKYLLFVSPDPQGSGVGVLTEGASAAYKLDAQGRIIRMSSVNTTTINEIVAHEHIDRLRSHIQVYQNKKANGTNPN